MIEHRVARPRGGRRPPCSAAVGAWRGPRMAEAQAESRALAPAGALDPPGSDMERRSDLGERCPSRGWARVDQPGFGVSCRPSAGAVDRPECRAAPDVEDRPGAVGLSVGGKLIRRALRARRGKRGLRAIGTGGRIRMWSGPLRAERVRGLRAVATMECDATKVEAVGHILPLRARSMLHRRRDRPREPSAVAAGRDERRKS